MYIAGHVRSGAHARGKRNTEMAPRTSTLRVSITVVMGLVDGVVGELHQAISEEGMAA